jgi:PAS domain S-box-containing protein
VAVGAAMTRAFAQRFVLPTLLSVALFVVAIFWVFIPSFERAMMDRKQELIRELTHSAWNILASFHVEETAGRLTREQAQAQAIAQIRNLHYGQEMKDYFWINDMTPRMVVHPYRRDLEGKDLSDLQDPSGTRVFVEFVNVVRRQGAGMVAYQWQWKDDPTHIVPKISYVKGFAPWGWIIGTGIYVDDVKQEIASITRRLILAATLILLTVSTLLTLIVRQSWRVEVQRRSAEVALRESEERYRTVIESASESILLDLGGGRLIANPSALALLGYTADELTTMKLTDLVAGGAPVDSSVASRQDAMLRRRDGSLVHVLLSFSPMTVGPQTGTIIVASDITERKRAEAALGQSQAQLREEVEQLRLTVSLLQSRAGESTDLRMLDQLRNASSPAEVARLNQALPAIVRSMVEGGARAGMVNRFITLNSDAVLDVLCRLGIAEIGPPPCPFVFLILGSEGRHEQTLCTDQDNALVFADVPEDQLKPTTDYFLQLSTLVCQHLHDAGYHFCRGNVMAKNPRWCMPLSAWKRTFAGWIGTLESDDLLQAKIFFDFRPGYGDPSLTDDLRSFLKQELATRPRFFAQLARNVLLYTAPLGVFGQFLLETTPDGRKGVNIKNAMTPLTDFARIYALRHGVDETNTTRRLHRLRELEVLRTENCQEILEVHASLMQIRIENQVRALADGRPPDNLVDPSRLTHLELRLLKEAFTEIRHFQSRLGYDFTGMAEVPA